MKYKFTGDIHKDITHLCINLLLTSLGVKEVVGDAFLSSNQGTNTPIETWMALKTTHGKNEIQQKLLR